MAKNVKVRLVEIKNVATGNDPGSELEVYGHLGTWKIGRDFGGNPIDRGRFLHYDNQNPDHAENIPQGFPLTKNVDSPPFVIESNEELWVGGHLKEEDNEPNPNDSLGDRHTKIKHDDIVSGEKTVQFFEGGQIVDAKFKITVL